MARKQTLVKLVDDLRAEIHASQNPAHNAQVRDSQIKLLQRTQEWLWEGFDWPHLHIERNYPAEAGQRLYDFGANFDLERIESLSFRYGGRWVPLHEGIGDAEYTTYNSELNSRAWPIRKFRVYEGDQIELWPIADQNGDLTTLEGCIKVKGTAKLSPLVKDTDRADLDDRLIVLYAAAEMLGGKGSKDAQLKFNLAKDREAQLQGKLVKRTKFRMFGVGAAEPSRRPTVYAYRPPVSTGS